MSLLDIQFDFDLNDKKKQNPLNPISAYKPEGKEKDIRQVIINHFRIGDLNARKPRREFNDLSVLTRGAVDQMSFNTYQPNNGEALEGDETNAWKSKAIKPIVRNKCISVAAHATARLIFPKIFAYNDNSEEQIDAATVMEDLNEWAGEQCDYEQTSVKAILTSLWSPVSIVNTEYKEIYKTIKKLNEDGKGWTITKELDEDLSGFQDEAVPYDELFIANFYENDVQRQDWLIRRKIRGYDSCETEYKDKYDNFKYVRPGMQIIYNEANLTFYEVYDSNLRQEFCEEVKYYNKRLDLYAIVVNGVLLTDPENPNPRNDKRYPFITFGYEYLDEGKCFYYKSLAFKLMQDANIVNSLYPMIIDGTYLNLMPPMMITGADAINSDVIVPGAVSTISSPEAKITPISTSNNLTAGFNALSAVEESLQDSSITNMNPQKNTTAYAMSVIEQEASTMLGMFVKMISRFVKGYGKLRNSDICQYLTIADVSKIIDDSKLVYKTFLRPNKNVNGKEKTRRIQFTSEMPEKELSKDEELNESYKILEQEGGTKGNVEIFKVNPEKFRSFKYMIYVTPDQMKPKSDDLERTLNLEEFDRAILLPQQGVNIDAEQIARDLLFSSYSKTKRDVDKYFKKEEPMAMGGQQPQQQQPPINEMKAQSNNPLATLMGKSAGANILK